MNLKRSIMLESIITMAAFIWFLPSVCPHMCFKMNISKENFVTLDTKNSSVTKFSLEMLILKHIRGHTLGINHTNAVIVIMLSHMIRFLRFI